MCQVCVLGAKHTQMNKIVAMDTHSRCIMMSTMEKNKAIYKDIDSDGRKGNY